MRSTHTYAILEISPEAHAEIKAKLLAAGYSDQIHDDTVDMHGLAVKSELEPDGVHHCSCTAVHKCPINVHPDPVVHKALSDLVEAMSEYDERVGASSRLTLHSALDKLGEFHSHTFNNKPAGIPAAVKSTGRSVLDSVCDISVAEAAGVPLSSIREHFTAGVLIDKHGNVSGDPEAVADFQRYARSRPTLLSDYVEPNQAMIVDEQAFTRP